MIKYQNILQLRMAFVSPLHMHTNRHLHSPLFILLSCYKMFNIADVGSMGPMEVLLKHQMPHVSVSQASFFFWFQLMLSEFSQHNFLRLLCSWPQGIRNKEKHEQFSSRAMYVCRVVRYVITSSKKILRILVGTLWLFSAFACEVKTFYTLK